MQLSKITSFSQLSITAHITERGRRVTNRDLDVVGEVLVLHGEVHGPLQALVAGVHHLSRQPRQRLLDVQVMVRVVQVVVPEPCTDHTANKESNQCRRRRTWPTYPRPAGSRVCGGTGRSGTDRTCGGGRRRRSGGRGPAGSGAGSRTTPKAWRASSRSFQKVPRPRVVVCASPDVFVFAGVPASFGFPTVTASPPAGVGGVSAPRRPEKLPDDLLVGTRWAGPFRIE